MAIGKTDMATKKDKLFKYDGRSRPTTNLYQQNFDRIFGKKEQDELKESYKQSLQNKKDRNPFNIKVKEEKTTPEELKEIEERNGF